MQHETGLYLEHNNELPSTHGRVLMNGSKRVGTFGGAVGERECRLPGIPAQSLLLPGTAAP